MRTSSFHCSQQQELPAFVIHVIINHEVSKPKETQSLPRRRASTQALLPDKTFLWDVCIAWIKRWGS